MNPSKKTVSIGKPLGRFVGALAFMLAAVGSLIVIRAAFTEFVDSAEYLSGRRTFLWEVPRLLPFVIALGVSVLGVRYAVLGSRKAFWMAAIVAGIAGIVLCVFLYVVISEGDHGWH